MKNTFPAGWAIYIQERYYALGWMPWPLGRMRLSADEIDVWVPFPFTVIGGSPLKIGRSEIVSYKMRPGVLDRVTIELAGPMNRVSLAYSRSHRTAVNAWLADHGLRQNM